MELKGKTIVVTGAASGLGRKTAQMLAAKGARLALAGIDEDGLRETALIFWRTTISPVECWKWMVGCGYSLDGVDHEPQTFIRSDRVYLAPARQGLSQLADHGR